MPRFVKERFIQPLTAVKAAPSVQRRQILVLSLIVFLSALAVRSVVWRYWRHEALKVQTTVTSNYKRFARLLLQEGIQGYFRADSAMSDPDLLGHPPGYPFFLAVLISLAGDSDTVIQIVQIAVDAMAAVLLFLIGFELLGRVIGVVSGMLAAMSPQFSWNALLILPDSISVLPLLASIYLLILARRRTRWWLLFLVGVLIGLSCLLRPNNLLLAPFLALLIFVLPRLMFPGNDKLRRAPLAALVLAGCFLIMAPVTIRNAVVFGEIVPLSLGAGQTILEGIADYDQARRFGLPETDIELAQIEAREQQRPDYAQTLFGPDGIKRERLRLKRGLSMITTNPFWFVGVMVQRAVSMLRFERVPVISAEAGRAVGYPSFLRIFQNIFTTAFMLSLVLIGAIMLVMARRWSILWSVLLVPGYYFLFQSVLHTEYRYIIALHYFLLVPAATCIYLIAKGAIFNRNNSF